MSYDPNNEDKNLTQIMIVVFVATALFSALLTFLHFWYAPVPK